MFFNKPSKEFTISEYISYKADETYSFYLNTKFLDIKNSTFNDAEYDLNEFVIKSVFFFNMYKYRIRHGFGFDKSVVIERLSHKNPEFNIQHFTNLIFEPNPANKYSNHIQWAIKTLQIKEGDFFSIGLLLAIDSDAKRSCAIRDEDRYNYNEYFSTTSHTRITVPEFANLSQNDLLTTVSYLLFFFCVIFEELRIAKEGSGYENVNMWRFLEVYESSSFEEMNYYTRDLINKKLPSWKSIDSYKLKYIENDLQKCNNKILEAVRLLT